MQPLGTKVYLFKRYSPSDSFCTFFSESVGGFLSLIINHVYDRLSCLSNVKLPWQRHWQVIWCIGLCQAVISNNVIFALKMS